MPAVMVRRRRKRGPTFVVPSFISYTDGPGGSAPGMPVGTLSTDFALMFAINAAPMSDPSGWAFLHNTQWYIGAVYHLQCWKRIVGAATTFPIPGAQRGAGLIYRGASDATNVNTVPVETTDAASTITVPGILTTTIYNRLVAIACDRDPTPPTNTGGTFTSRGVGTSAAFGMRVVDAATGVIGTSGNATFNQATTNPFRAAGYMIELLP